MSTSSLPVLPWARLPGSPASAPQAKPSAGQAPWPLSLRGHGIWSPVCSRSGPPLRSSEPCWAPDGLSLCPSPLPHRGREHLASHEGGERTQVGRRPGTSTLARQEGPSFQPTAPSPLCPWAVHRLRVTEENRCTETQSPVCDPRRGEPSPARVRCAPPPHSPPSRRQPTLLVRTGRGLLPARFSSDMGLVPAPG